ncbi:hypothetical protein J6590_015055 [Homalodisca vitripennis]|nr:hypothetical protein J6590_015055 [Homalodisca vitripennis]
MVGFNNAVYDTTNTGRQSIRKTADESENLELIISFKGNTHTNRRQRYKSMGDLEVPRYKFSGDIEPGAAASPNNNGAAKGKKHSFSTTLQFVLYYSLRQYRSVPNVKKTCNALYLAEAWDIRSLHKEYSIEFESSVFDLICLWVHGH